jgi:hypothetical protein
MVYDFTSIIDRLARTQTAPDTFNQYEAGTNPYNVIRRNNLQRYLKDMYARQPKIALIAEAPGYKGMRLTGIPFLSRRMLVDSLPALHMFGASRGFQDVPEPSFEWIRSEQSGTIVWNTLSEIGIVPFIWSAFPFHPHEKESLQSNRPPRRSEVKTGAVFLAELLDIFKPEKVIAVGNVANGSLTELGVACVKIRHPAQGGKNDFVAGLKREIG